MDWSVKTCSQDAASALADALDLSETTARVLVRRGYEEPAEARAFTSVFDHYQRLAPQFDLVEDARGVESIDLDALHDLVEWLRTNARVVGEHARNRIAMIPPGRSFSS